ncbi:hypothetical protein AX15_005454 [Amanita polypyramis BW_CC]|nr:hypothetical protein AX15_005454 [Amanita polypyramis BW_CC]
MAVKVQASLLTRVWTAIKLAGLAVFEDKKMLVSDESFVFVCRTPERNTKLTSPPPVQCRRKVAMLASEESFVIVCSTPERATKMTSPPPVLRKKVECDEVSDEDKEEYAAWVRKRVEEMRMQASY